MDFFEAVSRRRSIRNYSSKPVPPEVIERAIDAALRAPNSSNMQTWQIYWVRSKEPRARLVEACLNQGAARTAQELLVFTADPTLWKKNRQFILESLRDEPRKDLHDYYGRLMPFIYGYQWLNILKSIVFTVTGIFRPVPREVASRRDLREVCVKSCALACENFMLAIAAQGFDTCPMEGLDSVRVRRILGAPRSSTIVMAISVGERTERGLWGPQFRVPRNESVHEI